MEVVDAAAAPEGAPASRAARERVERVARRVRCKGSCIVVLQSMMAAGLMLDGGVEGNDR